MSTPYSHCLAQAEADDRETWQRNATVEEGRPRWWMSDEILVALMRSRLCSGQLGERPRKIGRRRETVENAVFY
jgi:hypothetical protein